MDEKPQFDLLTDVEELLEQAVNQHIDAWKLAMGLAILDIARSLRQINRPDEHGHIDANPT
jgi:hypothetical protein